MPRNVRLAARLTADVTQFVSSMRQAGVATQTGMLRPMSSSMKYYGAIMAGTVGYMGVRMVSEFAQVERAWADVTTLLPTYTKDATDKMYENVRDFAVRTGNDIEDSINATYRAVSALFTRPEEQVQLLNAADTLSKAIRIDLNTAVQLIISSLNAFNLEATETGTVVDSLTTAIRFGVTTGEEFAKVMGKTLQPAKALGFELKEVTAGHAALTNAGISSAEAATYQRRAFVEMLRDHNKLNQAYKEFYGVTIREAVAGGLEYLDLWESIGRMAEETGESLFTYFGRVQGAQAAVVLTGEKGREVMRQTLEEYEGAAEAAANKVRETLQHEINKTGAAWKELMLDMGEHPVINIPVTFTVSLAGDIGEFLSYDLLNLPGDFDRMLDDLAGHGLDFRIMDALFGSDDKGKINESGEQIIELQKIVDDFITRLGVFNEELFKTSGMYDSLTDFQRENLDSSLDLAKTYEGVLPESLYPLSAALQENLDVTGDLTESVESLLDNEILLWNEARIVSSELYEQAWATKELETTTYQLGKEVERLTYYGNHYGDVAGFMSNSSNILADAQYKVWIETENITDSLEKSIRMMLGLAESARITGQNLEAYKDRAIQAAQANAMLYTAQAGGDITGMPGYERARAFAATIPTLESLLGSWDKRHGRDGGGGPSDEEDPRHGRDGGGGPSDEEDPLAKAQAEIQARFDQQLIDLRFERKRRDIRARATETDLDDHGVDLWFHEMGRKLGESFGGAWEGELLNPLHRELILLHDAIEVWVSRDKVPEEENLLQELKKITTNTEGILENTDPDNGRPIHVTWDEDALPVRKKTLGWEERFRFDPTRGRFTPRRVLS